MTGVVVGLSIFDFRFAIAVCSGIADQIRNGGCGDWILESVLNDSCNAPIRLPKALMLPECY